MKFSESVLALALFGAPLVAASGKKGEAPVVGKGGSKGGGGGDGKGGSKGKGKKSDAPSVSPSASPSESPTEAFFVLQNMQSDDQCVVDGRCIQTSSDPTYGNDRVCQWQVAQTGFLTGEFFMLNSTLPSSGMSGSQDTLTIDQYVFTDFGNPTDVPVGPGSVVLFSSDAMFDGRGARICLSEAPTTRRLHSNEVVKEKKEERKLGDDDDDYDPEEFWTLIAGGSGAGNGCAVEQHDRPDIPLFGVPPCFNPGFGNEIGGCGPPGPPGRNLGRKNRPYTCVTPRRRFEPRVRESRRLESTERDLYSRIPKFLRSPEIPVPTSDATTCMFRANQNGTISISPWAFINMNVLSTIVGGVETVWDDKFVGQGSMRELLEPTEIDEHERALMRKSGGYHKSCTKYGSGICKMPIDEGDFVNFARTNTGFDEETIIAALAELEPTPAPTPTAPGTVGTPGTPPQMTMGTFGTGPPPEYVFGIAIFTALSVLTFYQGDWGIMQICFDPPPRPTPSPTPVP